MNIKKPTFYSFDTFQFSGAKQMAENAMNDPMAMVNNMKFW